LGSLFLDALSLEELWVALDCRDCRGAKRSATSGRSNDGMGRERLLELAGTTFLKQNHKSTELRTL